MCATGIYRDVHHTLQEAHIPGGKFDYATRIQIDSLFNPFAPLLQSSVDKVGLHSDFLGLRSKLKHFEPTFQMFTPTFNFYI